MIEDSEIYISGTKLKDIPNSIDSLPSLVIKNVVNPHRPLRHAINCVLVIYIKKKIDIHKSLGLLIVKQDCYTFAYKLANTFQREGIEKIKYKISS